MQADAVRESTACQRLSWMCTRLHLCLACLASRNELEREMRVNTLTSRLVCDKCASQVSQLSRLHAS